MRQYLQAYKDLFGTGLVKGETIQKHIEQQTTIDTFLPDSASFFYVAESPSHTYHFMGRLQENVSGYTNEEFLQQGIGLFLQCLHPEEIDIIVNQMYPDGMDVISQADEQEKQQILTQYNYRFKRKTGEYINLMEQLYVLEVDENGLATLILGNIIVLDNEEVLPLRLSSKIFRNNAVYETIFSKVYNPITTPLSDVTGRELDILRNLAAGKRSKEIAKELFISPYTVDTHRRNLLKKLQCNSVVELAKIAFKYGLL
ncbi:LuxR C-terminal-related transcriptional regulator [Desulfopila aestuarii]|uniref:PAS fold-containing protein n=1 Tax=Desulfopila aestuarii DSM 18488 TaxID=1121416 RepID=A0A1M7YBN9_9BACT|nr:LuxR C-terminal-related transcriptional regulator [Desulfopila aestuarii]SHO49938.1 PAS fold-containing protein [Desulfopila aestuarii DSM 18488]